MTAGTKRMMTSRVGVGKSVYRYAHGATRWAWMGHEADPGSSLSICWMPPFGFLTDTRALPCQFLLERRDLFS
jgi:hypothetical protein